MFSVKIVLQKYGSFLVITDFLPFFSAKKQKTSDERFVGA
jgi:hypothetical protein